MFGVFAGTGYTLTGSGVVFESVKVGQALLAGSRPRASGAVSPSRSESEAPRRARCATDKERKTRPEPPTPGTPQVGPEIRWRAAPSSRAVAGGFSTPPPFTAHRRRQHGGRLGSPVGRRAGRPRWSRAETSQLDQLRRPREEEVCASLVRPPVDPSNSVETLDGEGAIAGTDPGCRGRFVPDAGGFSERGLTSAAIPWIPTQSRQRGARLGSAPAALKVGTGSPYAVRCGRLLRLSALESLNPMIRLGPPGPFSLLHSRFGRGEAAASPLRRRRAEASQRRSRLTPAHDFDPYARAAFRGSSLTADSPSEAPISAVL